MAQQDIDTNDRYARFRADIRARHNSLLTNNGITRNGLDTGDIQRHLTNTIHGWLDGSITDPNDLLVMMALADMAITSQRLQADDLARDLRSIAHDVTQRATFRLDPAID